MSANLNLPALVGGQANPETTTNDIAGKIDAAVTETLVIDLTNSVALTALLYRSAVRFNITPTGAAKVLTLPAVKKLSYISNGGINSCTLTVGTTSIVLAVGGGGFFYTDGTVNGLLQLASSGGGGGGSPGTIAYDLGFYATGVPTANRVVLRQVAVRAFTLPAALTGSVGKAGTAATASTTFDIRNNGTSIGSFNFAIGATVPTFTFAAGVTFAVGDIITVVAPASPDATLADVSVTLAGSRVVDLTSLQPFDLGFYTSGVPTANKVVLRFNVVRNFILPTPLTGSKGSAGVAATASTVFDIRNNGVSIGSLTFAAAGTVPTYTFAANVNFVPGDLVTVVAPASPDATLADVAVTFMGYR